MSDGGLLIINADDWGRDSRTTDSIADCVHCGTVSSVSAMVFMEDSERSASIAGKQAMDVGLHLNLTTPFSAPRCSEQLMQHQQKIISFFKKGWITRALFHPGLMYSFEHVVSAQIEEFSRLYGKPPQRIDGHHHMHLCANVLFARLLPAGTIARRNFSFQAGEKNLVNRLYRRWIDKILARRHHLADYFFLLPPLDAGRLQEIFSLTDRYVVEVETHPADPQEYSFLTGREVLRLVKGLPIGPPSAMLKHSMKLQ